MSVSPEDLIAPKGLVELFMFPTDDREALGTRLGAFIEEAIARQESPADPATRAWAYYRAFTAVVIRLSTLAEQVSIEGEHSHRFGARQVERLREIAQEQLTQFEALTATPPSDAQFGASKLEPTW